MIGFLGRHIYVRIHPEWLSVRDTSSGQELKEPPLMALSAPPKRRVLAIGHEAARLQGRSDVTVVNPFLHPRTPLSDFTIAEQLLKAFLRKLDAKRLFRPLNVIVVSLRDEPDGGLTQIEIRAMKELAIGAGAGRAIVWSGPALSDEQVRKLQFPTTGDVLD